MTLKKLQSKVTLIGLAAIAILAFAQPGLAIVVGPNAGVNQQSYLFYQATGPNYELALTQVSFEAGGPYWDKNLFGVTANGGFRPVLHVGDTLTLVEHLQVSGDTPWSQWHEVFMSDGLSWQDGTVYYGGTTTEVTGLNVTISQGPNGQSNFNNIDFNFDTLAPGAVIDIVKTMVWDGLAALPPNSNLLGSDTIVVRESPFGDVIPEPAVFCLLALGGCLLGLLRRRHAFR